MLFLISKFVIVAAFSSLTVTFCAIVLPDFIYNRVKNKKLDKFLESYFGKALMALSMVVICSLLIIGFINLIA